MQNFHKKFILEYEKLYIQHELFMKRIFTKIIVYYKLELYNTWIVMDRKTRL